MKKNLQLEFMKREHAADVAHIQYLKQELERTSRERDKALSELRSGKCGCLVCKNWTTSLHCEPCASCRGSMRNWVWHGLEGKNGMVM